MHSYKTFQGAARAARFMGRTGERCYRPILRVLNGDSTEDLFVVLDDMRADIQAVNPETGKADGRIKFYDLTVRGTDVGS